MEHLEFKIIINEMACFHRYFGRNPKSPEFLLLGMVNSCVIANLKQFFCFVKKKALIRQRIQILAKYVDPDYRILSDALY